MSEQRIRIRYRDEEGVLVRIIGLAERRGYKITALEARGGEATLTLTARDPGRRLNVFAEQLRRLHDVTEATPFPATPFSAHVASAA